MEVNNITDSIPLRFTCENLKYFQQNQAQYEDSLLIREKSFEKPEDLVKEAEKLIRFIKNDARPLEYQDYYARNQKTFTFFYEKMDRVYDEKNAELNALYLKDSWETKDSDKENEIRSVLRDLIRCEINIHDFLNQKEGYAPNFYLLLETLFDDQEILDGIILGIYQKMTDWDNESLKLNANTICFVFPFMKVFYNGRGTIVDFWNDHQNFLKNACSVEDVIKEVERILKQYTDFGESEITKFCQEIRSASGDLHARRKILRRITQEKKRFSDESGYYELLGNLSVVGYLWNQEKAGSEICLPFLRVGIVTFFFAMKGWHTTKMAVNKYTAEFNSKFSALNCQFELDLPLKMLRAILGKLNKEGLNEKYLQVLEISAAVARWLYFYISENYYQRELEADMEQCCEGFLVKLENDQDKDSFIWHDFAKFLSSNLSSLNQIQSNYTIGQTVTESLVPAWTEFGARVYYWDFIMFYDNGLSHYKPKYFSGIKRIWRDMVDFIASGDLPEYVVSNMTETANYIFRDSDLLENSDFEELFSSLEKMGIELLQGLKRNVEPDQALMRRLTRSLKLASSLMMKRTYISGTDSTAAVDFIKKIYESKLIEELILVYEENKSLLQNTKSPSVTEGIWGLFVFIVKFFEKDTSFLTKEKNLELLKLIIQDSTQIDLSTMDKQSYRAFSAQMIKVLGEDAFIKYLKEEEMFAFIFSAVKLHIFSPFLFNWEDEQWVSKLCNTFNQDVAQKKMFLHMFDKFLKVFEEKMKNPSLDFEKAFKQFESGIENEKKNYEIKIQQDEAKEKEKEKEEEKTEETKEEIEKEEETKTEEVQEKKEDPKDVKVILEEVPFKFSLESPIFNGEVILESLEKISAGYCQRITPFTYQILNTYKSDIKKLREPLGVLLKRFVRTSFSPVFALSSAPYPIRMFKSYLRDAFTADSESYVLMVEAFFEGILDVCKEFKFDEFSTISKLDRKKLYRMIRSIAYFSLLPAEDLNADLTGEEAMLMATVISCQSFNHILRDYWGENPKEMKRLEGQFKEVVIVVGEMQKNILKHVTPYIIEENFEKKGRDLELFAKNCQNLFYENNLDLNLLPEIFKKFENIEDLKSITEENMHLLVENFDLYQFNQSDDQSTILGGIFYNGLRLKEFSPDRFYVNTKFWEKVLTRPKTLEILLKAKLDQLEFGKIYGDSGIKDLMIQLTRSFESFFSYREPSENKEEIIKTCFETEDKALFKVILNFFKSLGAITLPGEVQKLTQASLDNIFDFCEKIYKVYSAYIREKIGNLDIELEKLKNPKTETAEAKAETEPEAEAEVEEKKVEVDGEVKPEVETETEEKKVDAVETKPETKVKIEVEEKIEEKKEDENKKENENENAPESKTEEEKVDPKEQIEKLEKERAALIDQYKPQIEAYFDAVLECRQHYRESLKKVFPLGEEWNVVPKEYWTKLYEKSYKRFARFLMKILDNNNTNLKERLEKEAAEDQEVQLKDKLVDQICQFDSNCQDLKQLLIEEIKSEINLSKDFIEGLMVSLEQVLQSLVSEDLVLLRKERKYRDFPETLKSLILEIFKFAANYIISHVVNENCQFDGDKSEFQGLLLTGLDLCEGVLDVQQHVLNDLRKCIFDGNGATVGLINAILRANKSLRVEFMNRNILEKLLSGQRVNQLSPEQIKPVLNLMTTLLEDSLVFESQVGLALNDIFTGDSCSLETLVQDDKFKPFKNYKKTLEILKNSGIKCDQSNGEISEKDFSIGKESIKAIKIDELEKNLSPVAEKSLQIFLTSLIENYLFDATSFASFEKFKEKDEYKKSRDLEILKILRGDGYMPTVEKTLEEDYGSNVYVNESLERKMIQKETSALVVVLSGLLSHMPHLIPFIAFQDISSIKDFVDRFEKDDETLSMFLQARTDKKWSLFDILLRVILWRDGSSAIFLIASLIQHNVITASKEEEKALELRYILLLKIFEIMEDMLQCEESKNLALESLKSQVLRRNIAMIVSFLSSEINKTEELPPSLGKLYKEEIIQLIMPITQRLLENPKMILYTHQDCEITNHLLKILSDIVKQNVSKSIPIEDVKNNYAKILKALDTRTPSQPKSFPTGWKDSFEKNLFASKNAEKKKISQEDQRRFEMWDEKSQWEKEETMKTLEIADLKNRELIKDIKLGAYEGTGLAEGANLGSLLQENGWMNNFEYQYKGYEGPKGNNFRKLEYTMKKFNETNSLANFAQDNQQNFAGLVDSQILLSVLKADLTKIENLKTDDDDTNIAKLYVKEYTVSNQKNSEPEPEPESKSAEENEKIPKEEEKETEVKAESAPQEEQKVEAQEVSEKKEEEEEVKEEKGTESAFKYFMDVTVKNEENFKFRVNKALKQGMRLKEMICIEKALTGSDKNTEEIIKQFTLKMTAFDRNVVYASLGKSFETGLSEELKKIVGEARTELLDIQKDFCPYNEAKEKISKPEDVEEEKKETNEEVKAEKPANIAEGEVNEAQNNAQNEVQNGEESGNENKKEDEDFEIASNYDELDFDMKFLEEKEKAENNDEDKKEDDEGGEKEEEKQDNAAAEVNEQIKIEEAGKDETTTTKASNVDQLISSFEVNDAFVMKACKLLFFNWCPQSSSQKANEFVKNALGLNPANELKIMDTIMTVLYTSEFFESELWSEKSSKGYEGAVETILEFLSEYFNDDNRTHVFFVPKIYLEKFGNKILKDLKERTNYAQKISDCYSLFDMIVELIETPSFSKNWRWVVRILEGISSLLEKEKNLKPAEDVAQVSLEKYKKAISSKKLAGLLSLMEKSETQENPKIKTKVQEVFTNFKSIPEIFISLQDHLSSLFYQLILPNNKILEHVAKVLKQSGEKEIGAEEIKEIFENLEKLHLETLLTIILSFATVFQHNLFGEKDQKSSKTEKKIYGLLETVIGSIFTQEDVRHFFVNCHELLELIHKAKSHFSSAEKKLETLLTPVILTCLSHYSIIQMEKSYEEQKPGSRGDLRKQTGGSSLSDIGDMPSLARLISFEEPDHHHQNMAPLQRSYSSYRKELDVDFGAIFANFALKYSPQISQIFTSKVEGLQAALHRILPLIIQKCPWIIDFKTKIKIFRDQFEAYLKKHGIEGEWNRRSITIDRSKMVYSTMKQFKDLSKEDLIQYVQITYKDESGIDGGGLRRDFYEVVSKQLFDPAVGLFKLADNKRSLQPNALSNIVPYDLILMQFAGIILAKAISDKMVLDVTFTKPFLKHLLGKKITIGDMEEVDADLGKNLRWVLENNVEELYLTFTHEIEVLNERTMIELKEGGSDLFVDEENKKEYVKQICEYRMTKQIKKQLKAFLKGFRMVVPQELISHLSTSELEILISGESQIDLAEMKKHVTFRTYSQNDQIIIWLWEVLEEFSPDQLTSFYYFVSGSTKVPFGGFKEYPIRIYDNSEKEGLPIAHTCSYAIEIPRYDSKDKLREKLLTAIFDGAGEFQIS